MDGKISYEKASQIRREAGYNMPLVEQFCALWSTTECTAKAPVGMNFEKSITTWGYFGVTVEDFKDFLSAIENRGDLEEDIKWRYFCKCAWNVVRINREIVDGGYEVEP